MTQPRPAAPIPTPLPTKSSDLYVDLLRAAAGGDRHALEQLLTQVQEVTWRFSLAVCGGATDTEDAMQEALLRTFKHVARIRKPEAFRGWLHRTVRNACLMSRRRRVHEPARVESLDETDTVGRSRAHKDPVDPQPNPEERAMRARLRNELRDALQGLPSAYRAVVFLRDVEGLSTREVAHALDISEDNVKTRLRRARRMLYEALRASAP